MAKEHSNQRLGLAMAAAALLLIALDQWTKSLAAARLAGQGIVKLLDDFVVLVYARNKGAFLSLGSGLPPFLRGFFLVALPIIVLGFLGWALVAQGLKPADSAGGSGRAALSPRTGRVAAVLVIAGGAGNLVDRIAFGEVRDFLLFRLGGLATGIMNLADLYILAALITVVVAFALRGKGPDRGAEPRS